MSDVGEDESKTGVSGVPVTDHNPDFVPRKEDFKEALQENALTERGARLVGLILHTRVMRAYARFSEANGRLLAAGISFMAIFSLTAAVTLAGMLFSAALKGHTELADAIGEAVNSWLPGVVRTAQSPDGLVDLNALGASPGTGMASFITAGILIYTSSYVVISMSMAIRAMFGLATVKEHLLVMLGQRFLGLLILVLATASTALLITVNTYLSAQAAKVTPTAHHGWVNGTSQSLTFAASLAINMGIMLMFVWWVAGVHPLRRDLLWGSFFAALASTGLRLTGTYVVSKVTGPILTAATTLITLVVWINLQALVVLLASAWIANPPRLRIRSKAAFRKGGHRPNYPTLSDPSSLVGDEVEGLSDYLIQNGSQP